MESNLIYVKGKAAPIHWINLAVRPELDKPVIRVFKRSDPIDGSPFYIGDLIANGHRLPNWDGEWDNMIDTYGFTYNDHITVRAYYRYETFDEYHERTGKGHPDAKARETAQKRRTL